MGNRNPFSAFYEKEDDIQKEGGVITDGAIAEEINFVNELFMDKPIMDIHTFISGPGKGIGFPVRRNGKFGWYKPRWTMSEESFNALTSHLDPAIRKASCFLKRLGLADWYSFGLLKKHFIGTCARNLRFILLSLDKAYNEKGEVVRDHVYIPPQDVVEFSKLFPDKIYAGLSIHPDNPDFYYLLGRYASQSVVMKLIPPSQLVDLKEPRYYEKWLAAAKAGLSFLIHTGHESATPNELQDLILGHPRQLEPLLQATREAGKGGIVIAAHCGALGSNSGITFEKDGYFRSCLNMLEEYDNLYWDCSSLTGILRYEALRHVIRLYRDGHTLPIERMIFGTDQIALGRYAAEPAMFMELGLTYDEGVVIRRVKDIFMKEILLLLYLGLPKEVFTRGYELLVEK